MATNIGMLTPVVVPDRTRINPELVYYTDPITNEIKFGYPPTTTTTATETVDKIGQPTTVFASPEIGTGATIGGGSMSQMGAIGGVLGATGPTTSPAGKAAIDRLQNQADREACNASGGFYTLGGACLTGKEAEEQVNKIMNNPDAPASNKQAAEAWLERNAGETEDTTTDAGTGEDTSAISDEDAIASVLATVPEKLKGIITADNVIKVLEAGAKMNDPMTQIKRAMGAGVQFEWPGDWRNWKVFGPLAIPGVPLPPGIIDITIGEVIDAVGNIGGNLEDFVKDPIGTLGELGDWAKNKVTGVFGGTEEDPGWGGTLGGFEDWVKGVLGGVVGGAVLVDIYDGVKDIFDTGTDTTTTVVPGGTPPDEETTKTLKQGDDIVSLGGLSTAVERPEPDDIFGDTTDDDTLLGGDRPPDSGIDRRFEPFIPDEPPKPIEIDTGTGREAVDRDQDIFIADPEPPAPDPVVIGGGSSTDIIEDPPTTEIGGPTPTPSGGGGGGGGGGAGGTADPFLRGLSYTPTVPVAIRQQAPVDFASGLMSPTTSMDAIGQLIFRNLV
jgi:hypothetical protein